MDDTDGYFRGIRVSSEDEIRVCRGRQRISDDEEGHILLRGEFEDGLRFQLHCLSVGQSDSLSIQFLLHKEDRITLQAIKLS